jgi:hypothetical protein
MPKKKKPNARACERLALAYLCGCFKRTGRGETFYFLEPESLEEKKSRLALAYLLRRGRPSRAVRWHLASLIYPEGSNLEERRFVIGPAKIVKGGKGKPGALATHALDINVARRIANAKKAAGKSDAKATRVKIDPIVEDAAHYYGVSKSKAYHAYKAHRRRFESPLSVRFSTLK